MIDELRIRDLGVIDEAQLVLRPGFTVITGETGAGKTMLLTGLELVMGGRADPNRVRPGAERAMVEAVWSLPDDLDLHARLDELEVERDGESLIIARSVPADGRARAYLGARSVPSAALTEVCAHLVAVHGQGQQQRLTRSDVQRDVLDGVGGAVVAAHLLEYRRLYDQLRETQRKLADVTERSAERAAEAVSLAALIGDVDTLKPLPGEADSLMRETERLAHVEALRAATDVARESLSAESSDTDAQALVAGARKALHQAADFDPELADVEARLGAIAAQLADVTADLGVYSAALDADPSRLEAVHQRRAELTAFERRHGRSLDEVAAALPQLRDRYADLLDDDGAAQRLTLEIEQLMGDIAPVALALHQARVDAATVLGDRVGNELAALAMGSARVVWQVDIVESAVGERGLALPDGSHAALGAHGIDDVAVLLASHAEAPLLPIQRSASGGELSRVMLAIEVVVAGLDPVPTMVFDEVDAGVGGRAAVEVGRRLARLADSTQVLVVTHLPQVAAFADHHIVVTKAESGGITASDVSPVEGEARVRELARMLAGLEESSTAAEHARDLLDLARTERLSPESG